MSYKEDIKPVSIRISADLHAHAKSVAVRHGITIERAYADAIKQWLDEREGIKESATVPRELAENQPFVKFVSLIRATPPKSKNDYAEFLRTLADMLHQHREENSLIPNFSFVAVQKKAVNPRLKGGRQIRRAESEKPKSQD